MHMKCGCDNQEGSLCQACDAEVKEVMHGHAEAVKDVSRDLWWSEMAVKRSIVSASGVDVPAGFLYV